MPLADALVAQALDDGYVGLQGQDQWMPKRIMNGQTLNDLIWVLVKAQIFNGGGKLSALESSKFILAYLESPSKACCLNLDLKSL